MNTSANSRHPFARTRLADRHIVESNVAMFPLLLYPGAQQQLGSTLEPKPNTGPEALDYLRNVSAEPRSLFFHIMAALHSAEYAAENTDALHQDWPRIPGVF